MAKAILFRHSKWIYISIQAIMYYLLCNKIDGIWLYFWLCLIHTWRSVLYRSARALHSSILNTKRSIWNMNICINISMYTHIFFSMYVYAYIYIYIYTYIYSFTENWTTDIRFSAFWLACPTQAISLWTSCHVSEVNHQMFLQCSHFVCLFFFFDAFMLKNIYQLLQFGSTETVLLKAFFFWLFYHHHEFSSYMQCLLLKIGCFNWKSCPCSHTFPLNLDAIVANIQCSLLKLQWNK